MRFVQVTIPAVDAEAMLLLLLRERLVAGGTIFPIVHSRYWWNGEIVASEEAAIQLETMKDRIDPLVARIHELHPYDNPRILVFEPSERLEKHHRWVHVETR
ncbi:MAG TPA: divalent cation tolerance protein CutA [Myxococcota bacterium]|nr:divalent cation tolerance protein CutA [Myxococcota bacterium]